MTPQPLNRPCGVDVLRKLDWYATVLGKIGSAEQADDLKSIRAAVAELIAASRDLQDAMDEDDSNPFNPGPAARFHAADARHRAALAAVEGQP